MLALIIVIVARQSTKISVQADVGDGLVRAAVYDVTNQLVTHAVEVGTELHLNVELLPLARSWNKHVL